jgi:hypothetical protein
MPRDKDPKTGRFLPGNSGFGGRPKGSRNRLAEDFVSQLSDDFRNHGRAAIESFRTEDPAAYVKTIASLCPKELKLDSAPADLSDDELRSQIKALAGELRQHFGDDTFDDDIKGASGTTGGTRAPAGGTQTPGDDGEVRH